jgi:hypothetical protein
MQDTLTFSLIRTCKNDSESIDLRFDHSDMDIHDVLRKIAHFLLSVQYHPDSIRQGFAEFDMDSV